MKPALADATHSGALPKSLTTHLCGGYHMLKRHAGKRTATVLDGSALGLASVPKILTSKFFWCFWVVMANRSHSASRPDLSFCAFREVSCARRGTRISAQACLQSPEKPHLYAPQRARHIETHGRGDRVERDDTPESSLNAARCPGGTPSALPKRLTVPNGSPKYPYVSGG